MIRPLAAALLGFGLLAACDSEPPAPPISAPQT